MATLPMFSIIRANVYAIENGRQGTAVFWCSIAQVGGFDYALLKSGSNTPQLAA
jgi:hypothetical protein